MDAEPALWARAALRYATDAAGMIHASAIGRVDAKSNANDLVTDLDRRSERELVACIERDWPEHGLLGEEGAARLGTTGVVWVIDPLDGTVNFVYGLPAWCVSVGVERDGEPVAGAVVAPALGEAFVGWLGGGSWLIPWTPGRSEVPSASSAQAVSSSVRAGRRLHCSVVDALESALVGTGFSYDPEVRAAHGRLVGQLVGRVRDIRRLGSAALDLCAVAAGRLDGYFERDLNPWDQSAGTIIAREAGAIVERSPDGMVLASSPALAPELRRAVL